MKYDDASWHYGGDFPKDLPIESAATHIGMYVAWCLLNDLAGEIHTVEFPEALKILKDRAIRPGQWFMEHCDEKFTDEDLNEKGNLFTEFYYASDAAPYLESYEKILGSNFSTLYAVEDTWSNFDKIAAEISRSFSAWLKSS